MCIRDRLRVAARLHPRQLGIAPRQIGPPLPFAQQRMGLADLGRKQKVGVFVELANRKSANLGLPLPKGIVRVYKRDADATLQFIGEDAIEHTPVDETVRLKLGDAFDVVGNRKQTEWRKLASDTFEAAFEVSLRNHKDEAVTVKVVEPVPGDWQMLSSSIPHKKGDAATAEFPVPVPAKGETVLTYRVRIRY